MSERYSPGELQIFIHHHCSPARYYNDETDWYREVIARLQREGLLDADKRSTPRGEAFLTLLSMTPLPVEEWADPRSGEVIK